jgi:chromate reductase
MKVLGISGSLREGSYNTMLLRSAGELLPPGIELELYEDLKAIPPYDADDDVDTAPAAPAAVQALRDAIAQADAVLVVTPEYNASIPGVLKNALDWASRPHASNPLRGKPAAVVGASTGMFGAVWAQAEARKVLTTIGARVLDEELPVAEAPGRFDAAGRLADAELRGAYAELLARLAEAVRDRRAGIAAAQASRFRREDERAAAA